MKIYNQIYQKLINESKIRTIFSQKISFKDLNNPISNFNIIKSMKFELTNLQIFFILYFSL